MASPVAHIYNYSTADWRPLERAVAAAGLGLDVCGEFMWMCEQPAGMHQYKHRLTRRYAHLRYDTTDGALRVKSARVAG